MNRVARCAWTLLVVAALLGACSYGDALPVETQPPQTQIRSRIRVTAGDAQLEGYLYDNQTARAFEAMLPLTVPLWNPAEGFAKAFDLPGQIADEARTNDYVLGGLAYWYEGPSVAIFHSDHLPETIVRVVTIGRITDDVTLFATYEGEITIEVIQEEEAGL